MDISATLYSTCPESDIPCYTLPATSCVQDIVESDSAFTVTADAPGFDPQDVKIELKDGRITISGRKDEEKRQEKDGKVSSSSE